MADETIETFEFIATNIDIIELAIVNNILNKNTLNITLPIVKLDIDSWLNSNIWKDESKPLV